jgi:hypothetical protein
MMALGLLIIGILLDPFVGISLQITMVVIGSYYLPYRWLYLVAGGLGLIADIDSGRWLGVTSLIYLTLALILFTAREQFDLRQSWVVILEGFGGEMLVRLLNHQTISLSALVGQMLTCLISWWVIKQIKPKGGVYLKG